MATTYPSVLSGKDNGENIIKSIDEGLFKMEKINETLAEGAEGAVRPERDRVVADLTPEEKKRYKADIRATNILLQVPFTIICYSTIYYVPPVNYQPQLADNI
uniref:Integrase, catalytic region, zinc finger, CCHC-type, peptidase aspartic, catalytic n=1 Tax=Tanacetum cinerariifolium TaxID=118510 RepID=A0A699QK09_TANCI|nr:integrase, catalytic region, zinc finger, CCHC-type, peptidase aspartic, catalytic [Tanacetum cinerariifolium]